MAVQVFMSHTKRDRDFCDKFDSVAARVGIKVFRSEFEDIKPPAWKTIKKAIGRSKAMFLLVGKELVKAQKASETNGALRDEWKHTQNWIAYEVGLACQKGIDVWVCCDNVKINFPVPYLNNYVLKGYASFEEHIKPREIAFLKNILDFYSRKERFALGWDDRGILCPNDNCKSEFNFHSHLEKNRSIICPTCLDQIFFPKGWEQPFSEKKTSILSHLPPSSSTSR